MEESKSVHSEEVDRELGGGEATQEDASVATEVREDQAPRWKFIIIGDDSWERLPWGVGWICVKQ